MMFKYIISTAFVVFMTGFFLYATKVEQPYLYYQNLPFPVLGEVHAGKAAPMSVERCNDTDTAQMYPTTHTLKNSATGAEIIFPDVWISIQPGCHRSTSLLNKLPEGTPPGRYTFYGLAIVPGLLVSHKIKWYSEEFEVLP
ncbi:hypothetical protein Tiera_012 [Polaromonas phage Tiera]|nr:hypothetical protein Tiera_012 [Polaromonas phage Tiera]